MGSALGRFWLLAGRCTEGQQRIARLLQLAGAEVPTSVRPKLQRAYASLLLFQGDASAAQRLGEEALVLSRQYGSDTEVVRSILVLANALQSQGQFATARFLFLEAATLSRKTGDTVELVDALHYLTGDAFAVGDMARARAITDECLGLARSAGYARGMVRAEWVLGSLAYYRQDLPAARLHLETSRAASSDLNAWWDAVQATVWLGHVAAEERDYASCASLLSRIREFGQQLGDSEISCLFLDVSVHLAAVSGQVEKAIRLAAAVEAYRDAIGIALFPVMRNLIQQWIAPARARVGARRAMLLSAAGRQLSLDQALAEASTLDSGSANSAEPKHAPHRGGANSR
jgi:tetratricopeptide (TPR) repeat protein